MCDNLSADHWRPTASLSALRLRARLLDRVRSFFRQRGFLEVETPLLSADTIVDRHLEPFPVASPGTGHRNDAVRWLQTSPEPAMKRLLAAGAEAIYQVTRAFRQHEQGRLHNPEFTIVEWYRVGDDADQGIILLSDLCETLLGRGPAGRLSYKQAFEQYVGVDPHTVPVEVLEETATGLGISVPPGLVCNDRDGWLDLLFAERVQPNLGRQWPVVLCDYPASQAALARIRPGHPPVAERFELFVDGVELANGYHELTDPEEFQRRVEQQNLLRRGEGKPELPRASRLLAAMQHGLPSAAGCALGFDRVVMLAAGAKSLAEVMAFPFSRA